MIDKKFACNFTDMNFLTQISLGKRLLFPILSGLLMTVSFPETGGIWPLGFLAWIPLLAVENYTVREKKSAFLLFLSAYLTFFIYNVGTTWWVYNASSGGAMMAFFANSLLMALTFILFHLLKRKLGEKWPIRIAMANAHVAIKRYIRFAMVISDSSINPA